LLNTQVKNWSGTATVSVLGMCSVRGIIVRRDCAVGKSSVWATTVKKVLLLSSVWVVVRKWNSTRITRTGQSHTDIAGVVETQQMTKCHATVELSANNVTHLTVTSYNTVTVASAFSTAWNKRSWRIVVHWSVISNPQKWRQNWTMTCAYSQSTYVLKWHLQCIKQLTEIPKCQNSIQFIKLQPHSFTNSSSHNCTCYISNVQYS